MSARPLLAELSDRGIRVMAEGNDVTLSPKTAVTQGLIERVRSEKPALLRMLNKVRKDAGDHWEDIASNPGLLHAYYELLMIEEMRSKGVTPDHYTSTTTCERCGPVPIWEGCPPEVKGCPWCFNRLKGLPIPKEGNK